MLRNRRYQNLIDNLTAKKRAEENQRNAKSPYQRADEYYNQVRGTYDKVHNLYDSARNLGDNIGSVGNEISNYGNTMQKINLEPVQKFGGFANKVGTGLENFGQRIQTPIDNGFSSLKTSLLDNANKFNGLGDKTVTAFNNTKNVVQPLLNSYNNPMGTITNKIGQQIAQKGAEKAGEKIAEQSAEKLAEKGAELAVEKGATTGASAGAAATGASSAIPIIGWALAAAKAGYDLNEYRKSAALEEANNKLDPLISNAMLSSAVNSLNSGEFGNNEARQELLENESKKQIAENNPEFAKQWQNELEQEEQNLQNRPQKTLSPQELEKQKKAEEENSLGGRTKKMQKQMIADLASSTKQATEKAGFWDYFSLVNPLSSPLTKGLTLLKTAGINGNKLTGSLGGNKMFDKAVNIANYPDRMTPLSGGAKAENGQIHSDSPFSFESNFGETKKMATDYFDYLKNPNLKNATNYLDRAGALEVGGYNGMANASNGTAKGAIEKNNFVDGKNVDYVNADDTKKKALTEELTRQSNNISGGNIGEDNMAQYNGSVSESSDYNNSLQQTLIDNILQNKKRQEFESPVGNEINNYLAGQQSNYNSPVANAIYNTSTPTQEQIEQTPVQEQQTPEPPQGMLGNLQRLLAGYNNNYNNSIEEGNLFQPQQDKYGQTIGADGWGRTGEVLGSIARIAQNPTAQMLIAALISKKFNPHANWANALEHGYKYGQMAGERRSNQQVLNQMGYDVNNAGLFGGVSDNTMKAVYQDAYNKGRLQNTANRNEAYSRDIDSKINKRLSDIEQGNRKLDQSEQLIEIKKIEQEAKQAFYEGKLSIEQYNAITRRIDSANDFALGRERNAISKYSADTRYALGKERNEILKNKSTDNSEFNMNLSHYLKMKNSNDPRLETARNMMIQQYGKDPERLLKDM